MTRPTDPEPAPVVGEQRTAKILAVRGVALNWIGRLCSIAVTFLLTPYLVHTLGDARYGLWSIVMSLTSYYAIADLGLRGASTKFIAQSHAQGDLRTLNKVVVTTLFAYSAIAVMIGAATCVVAALVPHAISTAGLTIQQTRLILLLTGGTMLFRFSFQVFDASLIALQRYDIANAISVLVQLLQALAVVAALYGGFGLVGMAIATLCVTAIGQTTRGLVALYLLPSLSISRTYFDKQTLKRVLRFGTLTSLTHAARRITAQSGTLVIGVLLGPAAAAYYAIADALVLKSQQIGRAVNTSIDPLASRLDATSDIKSLSDLMFLGTRIMVAASVSIFFLLTLMGHRFVDLWIGPNYSAQTHPVLCVLAFAMVARMSSNPLRGILRGTNHLGGLIRAALLEIALTLVLAFPLVAAFGSIGMAYTIVIAQIASGIVVLPRAACRQLNVPLSAYFKNSWTAAIPVGITAWTIAFVFETQLPAQQLSILVVQILSVCVAAAAVTFFACLDSTLRWKVISALAFASPANRSANVRWTKSP